MHTPSPSPPRNVRQDSPRIGWPDLSCDRPPLRASLCPMRGFLLLAAVTMVCVLAGGATALAGTPLKTAVFDPDAFAANPAAAFANVTHAGASDVRLWVDVATIAPADGTKPTGFDPADPG